MDSSASEKEKLRSAYCPPVDDATFLAIASDYELPRDREILVAVLDTLKDGALEQENTDFDPSGTGGPAHARDATDTSRSSPGDTISNGVTSITTGLSELRWHEAESLGRELEDSTLEQKTAWLLNIFPDIPRRELASVLQSHDGDLDKATDELLNLSFLMQGYQEPPEPVPVLKSVDAFAEGMQPSRKGRKSKRNRTNESSRASSVSSSAYETGYAPSNVWSTMSEDTVRSAYHANGARLPTTIRALVAKEAAAYDRPEEIDPIIELQISEFQTEFEQVPKSVMYGLLILAQRIPSAAHELLEAMTAARTDEDLDQIRNAAHYTPLDLKDDTPWESPIPTRKTVTASSEQISAAAYRAAATQNFNQATSAWKKSKSDRLYGGAAAYYAEVGRERASAARALHAAEADTLVSRQSSSNVLDLHGVSVQDAVRIASSTTQRWWDGMGDAKYVSGGGGPARAGFRIVTGVGTHSKNHAPRIGPAVSKMLIREGWKIEIGHGELIVTGKIRR